MWRRTGAVVDLVVDDHVEVFLWEVSAQFRGVDIWFMDDK
jgi:hypothetical protein